MSLNHQIRPNGIAAQAIAARDAGSGLPLHAIRADGGTQSRAALNESTVEEYAAALLDGATFPPVIVFYDGIDHWLADGFHRFHAYLSATADRIPADVRQGTRRDAILYSVGANETHGLRRTNGDKRRAVLTLLNDAEWSVWSDREIARRCAVSNQYVSNLRPSVNDGQMARKVERNGSTYTMNTAAIGKPKDDEMDFAEDAEGEVDAPVEMVRGRLNIAEDITLDEIARTGMARERAGEEPGAVAKSFNLGIQYYRMACDVTFLFDRGGYSAADTKIVIDAFRMMVDEQKIPEAHKLLEPVAARVWGIKRETRPRADREPARIDQFEHAFGIIAQTCVTAAELDLPYLSASAAKSAAKEIRKARQHLATLLSRIEGIHE